MKLLRNLRWLLTPIALALTIQPVFAEDLTVWVYHDFPPFIVDEGQRIGLSYDLAEALSARSDGKFDFSVTVTPRQRLNLELQGNKDGIVFWANEYWFGDSDMQKYLWSETLLKDRSVVISPIEVPVDYTGPQSLAGMVVSTVQGHRYTGLDELVIQDQIERSDLPSEHAVVQFISNKRGTVGVIAQSALRFFQQNLELDGALFTAQQPHSTYSRRIMVQPALSDAYDFITTELTKMKTEGEWEQMLANYALTD